MTLLTELQRVMDLHDPFSEAKKKLIDTYVVVNGSLILLKEIESTTIQGIDRENKVVIIKVDTFDVFLPDSGIYRLKEGYSVLLIRQPKRQWRRSMSFSFYLSKMIEGKTYTTFIFDLYNNKESRSNIYIDSQHKIWYWDIPIGFIDKKNNIVCEDSNFVQELKDWSRDD